MARLLAALKRYQEAPRTDRARMGAPLDRQGRVVLRAPHGIDATPDDYQPDVLFVPSPINAPSILDLDADCSLVAWLHDRGHRPALLDWGRTLRDHANETVDDYVAQYLLPLLQRRNKPVHLVGYCLGGTIALAAACIGPVRSLTLIAAPWKFSGYPDSRRSDLDRLWHTSRGTCAGLGLVPMELIQLGFWTLSRSRLIDKFLEFGALDEGSPAFRRFIAVEDWANGGEPLPLALARQLFEDFYRDDVTGQEHWTINGATIAPTAVRGPAMQFVSRYDMIVPETCAPTLQQTHRLDSGHVGMVIGGKARTELWKKLDDWLCSHPSS